MASQQDLPDLTSEREISCDEELSRTFDALLERNLKEHPPQADLSPPTEGLTADRVRAAVRERATRPDPTSRQPTRPKKPATPTARRALLIVAPPQLPSPGTGKTTAKRPAAASTTPRPSATAPPTEADRASRPATPGKATVDTTAPGGMSPSDEATSPGKAAPFGEATTTTPGKKPLSGDAVAAIRRALFKGARHTGGRLTGTRVRPVTWLATPASHRTHPAAAEASGQKPPLPGTPSTDTVSAGPAPAPISRTAAPLEANQAPPTAPGVHRRPAPVVTAARRETGHASSATTESRRGTRAATTAARRNTTAAATAFRRGTAATAPVARQAAAAATRHRTVEPIMTGPQRATTSSATIEVVDLTGPAIPAPPPGPTAGDTAGVRHRPTDLGRRPASAVTPASTTIEGVQKAPITRITVAGTTFDVPTRMIFAARRYRIRVPGGHWAFQWDQQGQLTMAHFVPTSSAASPE